MTRAISQFLQCSVPDLHFRPAVVRPRDVVKKTPLHQMPAAIPEAERPDEPPVKTIQTTFISKITAAVSVRIRALSHAVPSALARSTIPADIAQQHSLIA